MYTGLLTLTWTTVNMCTRCHVSAFLCTGFQSTKSSINNLKHHIARALGLDANKALGCGSCFISNCLPV